MLSSDERENDVFFDSVDCWSSDESVAAKEECGSLKLDYGIWMSEPQSIKKRREHFLCGMGLGGDFASSKTQFCGSSSMIGLKRLIDCSGVVSTSGYAFNSSVENDQENGLLNNLQKDSHDMPDIMFRDVLPRPLSSGQECKKSDIDFNLIEHENFDVGKSKTKSWWNIFVKKRKRRLRSVLFESKENSTVKGCRIKVKQNKKKFMELCAVYVQQEINAHKGFIWTMKFSPDGKYLASGGEDGVVRVWHITYRDSYHNYLTSEGNVDSKLRQGKSSYLTENTSNTLVVIPEKVFQIEESPLQEFHGHSGDVLDLAWSDLNCLLSSSTDKTVRLWQVGCDQCLNVFHHQNYVTCIQFNPSDKNYFLSGSIDGKVRIWGVSERRVVDWAEIKEVITAICYRPNGNGFIVGSITGTCHFYAMSDGRCQPEMQIHIEGRKKTSGKRITGIQFSQENFRRVMITSEDSKIRIFDGIEIVQKYRGPPKSGSQISASFTSSGKHIISIGEDSNIYVWNYDNSHIPSSKKTKSMLSCEHFLSEGASIAIMWPGMGSKSKSLVSSAHQYCSQTRDRPYCFSLGNWFSTDGPNQGSATWPEEKLPFPGLSIAEDRFDHLINQDNDDHKEGYIKSNYNSISNLEAWGLVTLTAGFDGTIRTFHNYGLPVRL